ncbi:MULTISPECIES: hypothetical protein [unclassified Novosphingobium]|uniref:hypothetical protein n=1 Tax=unclassified Novosphingobium TaxID=2644732 RepID=UPI001494E911|nr:MULTISPECIES: hypothetical protein [unclassified Novosphingobium]MBB3359961.1 hypothetical protein [Novosphingobium sp. BK256]MBB3376320.1 hypothetical protein [Novosphingobium sp. BK280]MBB3380799.1 hypothetical protein [Novosphingobium sp. BK258]MBB3422385.1 hypothetical protein [Novosphingobium sp. BK267]MBB3451150.1 hypothetical protein [Novosphingobium sp. BK352]
MKTFAVSMALGASLLSTTAFAANQRPAPAPFISAPQTAPATPAVAKRKGLTASSTLLAVGAVAAVGVGVGVLASSGSDNNASPQ